VTITPRKAIRRAKPRSSLRRARLSEVRAGWGIAGMLARRADQPAAIEHFGLQGPTAVGPQAMLP
jgi:hypothetical protein